MSDAPRDHPKSKPRRRIGIGWWIAGALVALVIVFRLLLPTLVLGYANQSLRQLKGYRGTIQGVDLHLLRGRYAIRGLRVDRVQEHGEVPFVAVDAVQVGMSWDKLLRGVIATRLRLDKPRINIVTAKTRLEREAPGGERWLDVIKRMQPIRIDSCEIRDGEFRLKDNQGKVPYTFYFSKIHLVIRNLTNRNVPATMHATALAMGQAESSLDLVVRPMAQEPDFTASARMTNLDLTKLNDFLQAYGKFDVAQGRFDLVMQVAVRQGRMQGYVKPLFRDLKVLSYEKDVKQEHKTGLQLLWEGVVSAITEVFKNPKKNQVATQIPISGPIRDPKADLVTVIGNVLSNAFVRAFTAQFDIKPGQQGK